MLFILYYYLFLNLYIINYFSEPILFNLLGLMNLNQSNQRDKDYLLRDILITTGSRLKQYRGKKKRASSLTPSSPLLDITTHYGRHDMYQVTVFKSLRQV